MSSVKTIPLAGALPSTRFTLKIAFSTTPARESIVVVTKSTASRARSKLLTLNSDISQLPSPRNRAMAGWSAGYQAARVRRQHTLVLISSLPGTAGLPPFIFFSTNYPDLDSAVLTHRDNDRMSATLKLFQRRATSPQTSAASWPCSLLFPRPLPSASEAQHPFPNRGALGHFPGASSTGCLLSHSIQTIYK